MERDDYCVEQINPTFGDYVRDPDNGRLLRRVDNNLQVISSGINNSINYNPDDDLERKH